MHCRIWQITQQKLDSNKYISESDFYDGSYDFFDYVSDMEEEDAENDINEWLPNLMDGLFKCNGRELTFIGDRQFIQDWVDKVKTTADSVNESNVLNYKTLYDVECAVKYTHKDLYHRFYIGESGEAWPENFGDFVKDLYSNNKPGDKFYVGGVVDFHY